MTKLKLALGLSALVAVAAISVAIAAADGGTPAATTSAPTQAPGPDSFAVFRRAATPEDAMPAGARAVLAPVAERVGANLDDSRAVADSKAGTVWAFASADDVCLALPDPVDGYGANCASIDSALAGRLWTGLNALPEQVAGDVRVGLLVPDGVKSATAVATDGTRTAIAVSDNVAFADLSDSRAIEFATGATTITVNVPGTPAALIKGG